MSVRVLVADKFEKSGLDGLAAAGFDVVYRPDDRDDTLRDAVRETGAEALVVRSTKVTRPMLEPRISPAASGTRRNMRRRAASTAQRSDCSAPGGSGRR